MPNASALQSFTQLHNSTLLHLAHIHLRQNKPTGHINSPSIIIMLSRPATKISLTADDVVAYEQRKMARDAVKEQQLDSSQDSTQSTVEDFAEEDSTPAQQTRAAKAKASREQRIGVGNSRA